jgi:hypothetical protein
MERGEMRNSLLVFSMFIPMFLSGQDGGPENGEGKEWHYELGFVYGGSIGAGPAFRSHIGPWGYQVAYAPLPHPTDNDLVRSHVGFTLFYRPVRKERIEFFVYQGNYWRTAGGGNSHGLGIGIDFRFVGRIDMSLMGGYRLRSGPVLREYGPTAEIGFYYQL